MRYERINNYLGNDIREEPYFHSVKEERALSEGSEVLVGVLTLEQFHRAQWKGLGGGGQSGGLCPWPESSEN